MNHTEQGLIDAGDWGVLRDYYLDCSRDDLIPLIDLPLEAIEKWLKYNGIVRTKRPYLEATSVDRNYLRLKLDGYDLREMRLLNEPGTVEEGMVYLPMRHTIATRKTLFLALRGFHDSGRTGSY